MNDEYIRRVTDRLAVSKFGQGTAVPEAVRMLVTHPLDRDDRMRILDKVWQADTFDLAFRMLSLPPMNDDNIYRVSICTDGVDVVCFGLGIDTVHDGHYINADVLPKWVQERLAVLMMMSYAPPTEEVEGVGRRISRDVYWVYKPVGVA